MRKYAVGVLLPPDQRRHLGVLVQAPIRLQELGLTELPVTLLRAPIFWITVGLVTAALLAAASLWLTSTREPKTEPHTLGVRDDHESESPLVRGRREYATIRMERCLDDLADLRETLASMDVRDPEARSDGTGDELLDSVAEFLYLRFGQRDPQQYIEWRQRGQYRWRQWSELNDLWTIERDWSIFVPQVPFPGSDDLPLLFTTLFEPVLDFRNGANRPVAIASDPKGLTTVVDVMTEGNPTRAFVEGRMESELWHGTVAATACSWWEPPRSLEQLLREHGSVEYAEVGVVIEFADHTRHPVITTWARDPNIDRWTLQHLNSYNTGEMKLSAWYY